MKLQEIEYNNQKVLTTEQLAKAYGTGCDVIRWNLKHYPDMFDEGDHYYTLQGAELQVFINRVNAEKLVRNNTKTLLLWTRKGAFRQSRIFDSAKAKAVYKELEKEYFPRKESCSLRFSEDIPPFPFDAFRAYMELQGELKTETKRLQQAIDYLQPKADFCDVIVNTPFLMTVTQIAKDYGMSGGEFNKLLCDLKIQYKQRGQWLLYARYQGKGYTHSQVSTPDIITYERIKVITSWTMKGRIFIYTQLKKNGVVPVVERDEKAFGLLSV